MGPKLLLGFSFHVLIVSPFVLNTLRSLQEISTSPTRALDASSNASAIQVAPIFPVKSPPRTSGPTPSLLLANTTAPADNAALANMVVTCEGAAFSRGPATYASCGDAWEYTKSGSDILRMGDRASLDEDDGWPLPQRFLSDDGLCAFDYDVAEPGQVDSSSLTALKFAGQTLLNICLRDHYQGGVVSGLGQSGHLTVSLKPNTPSVQCSPSVKPPIGDVCQQVLDYLPASKMKQVFGSRDTAGIDVPIPYTLADPALSCVFKVRMTAGLTGGPSIRTSWYSIWQQAVALTVLCAHVGKEGQVYIRGGSQRQPIITISVVNEARSGLTIGSSNDTSQQRKE